MFERLKEIRNTFTQEMIYCKDPYTRSSNIFKYIKALNECDVYYVEDGSELTYDGHILTDREYIRYISTIANCTVTAMRKCLAATQA